MKLQLFTKSGKEKLSISSDFTYRSVGIPQITLEFDDQLGSSFFVEISREEALKMIELMDRMKKQLTKDQE